jgi:hypothetical protein
VKHIIPFRVDDPEILNGQALDAYGCPIALALVNAGVQVPVVCNSGWVKAIMLGPYVQDHGPAFTYGRLTQEAVAFIKAFDSPNEWFEVEPFSSLVTFFATDEGYAFK